MVTFKFNLPGLAFFILSLCQGVFTAQASAYVKPVRAVHVVIDHLTISDMKRQIDIAHQAGFNMIIIELGNKIAFNNFPGRLLKDAWLVDEFLSVASYIRRKGMEVVPAVSLLSHQGQFLASVHPELMFNGNTYNPSKSDVYKLVFAYLDEVIATVNPKAIHIGHDEVSRRLPADYFLQDVNRLHDYLVQRKVETWMWGDMLISRKEFPNMLPWAVNGNGNGYGGELRKVLPKDIVICDWHYADIGDEFPSLTAFKNNGFRVLGAGWRRAQTTRNFSRYAAQNGADGMIITTWFDPNESRVVQNWDELDKIISEAGKAFVQDFPDAK